MSILVIGNGLGPRTPQGKLKEPEAFGNFEETSYEDYFCRFDTGGDPRWRAKALRKRRACCAPSSSAAGKGRYTLTPHL